MLRPYVSAGQTALDLGCGMGYFSLGLAKLVGESGRVIAVDLQERMLAGLRRRAAKQGLGRRIEPRLCAANDLGIADLAGRVDLALAFWMLHEVPDQAGFLGQVGESLADGGRLLLAEPRFHVKEPAFQQQLDLARDRGWEVLERPALWGSRGALLRMLRQAA